MTAYAHLDRPIGYHRNVSDNERRKREAVMKIAERHFTAAEIAQLVADVADNKVDVRFYDDGIVLMRTY
jgi:hypothetical protein